MLRVKATLTISGALKQNLDHPRCFVDLGLFSLPQALVMVNINTLGEMQYDHVSGNVAFAYT